MPHQLMIGCYAEALSIDLTPDLEELEDCHWFTREEVHAVLAARPGDEGVLHAPPAGAIANRLMRDWLDRGL